jgi:hypothetical protein
MNPLKKQNKLYFDTEWILFTIHMVVSTERSFSKSKYFYEQFKVDKDSREIKWFGDSMYQKEIVG